MEGLVGCFFCVAVVSHVRTRCDEKNASECHTDLNGVVPKKKRGNALQNGGEFVSLWKYLI